MSELTELAMAYAGNPVPEKLSKLRSHIGQKLYNPIGVPVGEILDVNVLAKGTRILNVYVDLDGKSYCLYSAYGHVENYLSEKEFLLNKLRGK